MAYPRNTDDDLDDDAPSQSYRVAAAELRQFVERIERLESEKKDIADSVKEVYAEARARGYDNAALRQIICDRKKDASDLSEHEAIVELYKHALGMI